MADSEFVKSINGRDEIDIIFAKKDGKRRTIPVWFVVSEGKVELLPMYGLKTKWFRAVEGSGSAEIRAEKNSVPARLRFVREATEVDRVKQRFSEKYGEPDVRRYYPTSEIAVVAEV